MSEQHLNFEGVGGLVFDAEVLFKLDGIERFKRSGVHIGIETELWQSIVERLFINPGELWSAVSLGKLPLEQFVLRFVDEINKVNRVGSPQQVSQLMDDFLNPDCARLRVEILELVHALSHWLKIGLIAETNYEWLSKWQRRLNMNMFSARIETCSAGLMRSEQAFYRLVEQKLGLKAQQLMLFGEHEEYLEVAKSLGWQTYQASSDSDIAMVLSSIKDSYNDASTQTIN